MPDCGKQALDALIEQWHVGGWGIPQESKRRETLNVLLSMPRVPTARQYGTRHGHLHTKLLVTDVRMSSRNTMTRHIPTYI